MSLRPWLTVCRLYRLFSSMIFEKCVRYHENQKQQERRASKNAFASYIPGLDSPSMDSDLDEDITVRAQARRSGAALSPDRPKSKPTNTSRDPKCSTTTSAEICGRPLGAPVAQMIPRQPLILDGHGYHNESIEGRDTASSSTRQKNASNAIYLSDDDSQPMEQVSHKPLPHNSDLSPSLPERPEVDTRGPPSKDLTRKRLRRPNSSDFLEYSPPRDKEKMDQDSRLLATFRFTPERLAPILKDTPKRRHDLLESSDHSKSQSTTKKSKTKADKDGTLRSNPEQLAPSSKSRLKIRLSAARSSSASKAPQSSRPNKTLDTGSAVSSSATYTSNQKPSAQSRENRSSESMPGLNDNKLSSPATPQKGKDATAGSNNKSSSHPSAYTAPSSPSDGLGVGSKASISDLNASCVDSRLPKAYEQSARSQPPQPLSKDFEPALGSEGRTYSSETQMLPSSLLNEHCKSPSPNASQMFFQRANDELSNETRDQSSATQSDQSEHVSNDGDCPRRSNAKTHTPLSAYVEDEAEPPHSSTNFEFELQNLVELESAVLQDLADNRAYGHEGSTQAQSSPRSGVEAQPKDVKGGAEPADVDPSAESENTAAQSNMAEVAPTSLSQAIAPDQASQTAVLPDKSNADVKKPSETTQPHQSDDESKSHPITITTRASTEPGEESRSRKLFVQLNTTEANKQQFVVVGFDSSIDDLFSKIQVRTTRRLASKEILSLDLRLPSQREEESDFLVEKNDPDTWEWFLDMAREEKGDKIKVVATVEV